MSSIERRIDHLFSLYLEAGGRLPAQIVSSVPLIKDDGKALTTCRGMPIHVNPWMRVGELVIEPVERNDEERISDILANHEGQGVEYPVKISAGYALKDRAGKPLETYLGLPVVVTSRLSVGEIGITYIRSDETA